MAARQVHGLSAIRCNDREQLEVRDTDPAETHRHVEFNRGRGGKSSHVGNPTNSTCKASVVSGGKSITPPFLGTERTRRVPVALVMAILWVETPGGTG